MNELDHTAMQPPIAHVDTWESMAVDYLDDTLSLSDRARVDAHLETCGPCREAIEAQRRVMALTRSVPYVSVPLETSSRVLEALGAGATETSRSLRQDRRGVATFWGRLVRARWAPAAAAILMVAVAVAAWSGLSAQSGREKQGSEGNVAALTTSARALASGSGAVSVTVASDMTAPSGDQEGPVITASPYTTAAATTSTGPASGDAGGKATTTMAAAATTSTKISAPATLAGTSTTAGTAGVVATLGLTPVFLTVTGAAAQPAEAALASLPSALPLRQMPSRLSRGSATFAAVMVDADMSVFMTEMLGAHLTATVELDLPYDVGYLDQVAHELGLEAGPRRAGNLLIVTIKGG